MMNIYNFSYCFQTYYLKMNICHTCKWNFLKFQIIPRRIFERFHWLVHDKHDRIIIVTHKQVHAPCQNRDDNGVEGGGSSGGSGGDYERVSAAVQFLFSPGRPSPLSRQLSPPLLPWLN